MSLKKIDDIGLQTGDLTTVGDKLLLVIQTGCSVVGHSEPPEPECCQQSACCQPPTEYEVAAQREWARENVAECMENLVGNILVTGHGPSRTVLLVTGFATRNDGEPIIFVPLAGTLTFEALCDHYRIVDEEGLEVEVMA